LANFAKSTQNWISLGIGFGCALIDLACFDKIERGSGTEWLGRS
jgi:hypothetical protein